MTMEKLGIKPNILHTELRDEEADLMQRLQALMADPTKTATDRTALEHRLQSIRQRITDLDLQNEQTTG